MSNLPNGYEWLSEVGTLPRTIQEALKLYDTREIVGPKHNQTILGWAAEVGLEKIYTADETAWCGLLVAVVVKRAGKTVIDKPLWARNWAKFGDAVDQPGLGDVLVFVRDGGGHVGFYVAEDATAYHVLGGNQGNRVSITRVAKDRCVAKRRPPYNLAPASVKPYRVKASGTLSANEA